MERGISGFNPGQFPDLPLYNIQAVAAATGVPAITLRSWERRYGIPRPKRDPKGYRLYSERDIAVTRWLRVRVEQGVGISRAVNMLMALERGELGSEEPGPLDFDSLRARLLDAVRRLDEDAFHRILGEALMVAPVEEMTLKLLQPALYDIGELWAEGGLSVTTEHVGSNLIRSHLAQLTRLSPPPHRNVRVLVGCAPGELHDIGALILALFLRRRGYDVIYAGANLEQGSLIADIERMRPDAVCLSASTVEAAHELREVFDGLSEKYKGMCGFGGRVFNENQELRGRMPGVYLGADATEACNTIERVLAEA